MSPWISLASLLARLRRVDADETRLPAIEQLAHDLGLFAAELGTPWLPGQRKRSARDEILGELDLRDHRAEHLEPFVMSAPTRNAVDGHPGVSRQRTDLDRHASRPVTAKCPGVRCIHRGKIAEVNQIHGRPEHASQA
jgi:hypothetical protein